MVYQPVLSVMEIMVDISSGFCLSWTTIIGISTSFVCHEQYWLVCHQVLSVYTIKVGISTGFVCHGQ